MPVFNRKHIAILEKGVDAWNQWRDNRQGDHPNLAWVDLPEIDLRGVNLQNTDLRHAQLSKANLAGANLSKAVLTFNANLDGANLSGANLFGADLHYASLAGANLSGAKLSGAVLIHANLSGANLSRANLYGASLGRANLSGANLSGADLVAVSLVGSNCERAIFTGSRIYGVSVWDVALAGTDERNLIITPEGDPVITVDNLEVAQFIYLLLNNERIRHVIDTVTSKVVLILGRFTQHRKVVLDALREHLRTRNYTPVLFDFDKPANRDITETVSTLAHIARFVIADITDAKSIPQELMAIVPTLPSVPIQPLLMASQKEYGMFEDFKRYPWVLKTFIYKDQRHLLSSLKNAVIMPAEKKANVLFKKSR
jgi:hypothetical protein